MLSIFSPVGWLAIVSVGLILFSSVTMGLLVNLQKWLQGLMYTQAALEDGSELVGPHAFQEIHAHLDRFSAEISCIKPRLFMVTDAFENASPGAAWYCRGRPCISLTEEFVHRWPQLMKFILAHEFGHFMLCEPSIRTKINLGNITVLNTSFVVVLWSFVLLLMSGASGFYDIELLLRLAIFLLSSGLLFWIWEKTTVWSKEVSHLGEFAADAVGALLVGSSLDMAKALCRWEMIINGSIGLGRSSSSHPSTIDRGLVLMDKHESADY
ncbi:M48 family metalloprotease [Patescibacteria group bacterium]|nr:M48 family metalloprotease [Patescibacteria group bacterium]MBU1028703.1 M48 family metalloprotease [Patescibacteria group bacterium]